MSQLILPASAYAPTPQLSLFDTTSEAELYHPQTGGGFFALLYQGPSKKYQRVYKVSEMAKILDLVDHQKDTWISQAEFCRPNRRVVNLARVSLLFSDLDTYHSAEMKNLSVDAQVQRLHFVCDEKGIPPPSIVVFSGRGLQLKWLLDTPLPRAALPRWNACQRALQSKLAHLGADSKAKDASRVLRLVDTVHSKSGQRVQVVDVHGSVNDPARYNFDALADALLALTREEVQDIRMIRGAYKTRRAAYLQKVIDNPALATTFKSLNGRSLAWTRLEDLRTLGELRGGWVNDLGDSMRTAALHWQLNFLCLSGAANVSTFYHEARELANQIDPNWSYSESELGTLLQKAKEYGAGKKVVFEGRELPPLYTPRNSTLIDTFEITDDEQRKLKTIISGAIKTERNAHAKRFKRHQAGVLERSEYDKNRKSKADERAQQIRAMKAGGQSALAIAKRLDVTKRTVYNALKACADDD